MNTTLDPPWTNRPSAVFSGEQKYLCTCDVYHCRDVTSEDPRSGLNIAGNWISYRDMLRHSKADCLAELLKRRISDTTNVEEGFLASTVSYSVHSPDPAAHHPASSPPPTDHSDDGEEHSRDMDHIDLVLSAPGLEASPQSAVYFHVEKTLEDLDVMLGAISQEILGFSATAPLEFTRNPRTSPSAYVYNDDIPDRPNCGPLSLVPTSPTNSGLLAHEARMYHHLDLLERYTLPQMEAVEALRRRLRQMIYEEIKRICDIKGREWNAQREFGVVHSQHPNEVEYLGRKRAYFDCGKYTDRFLGRLYLNLHQNAIIAKLFRALIRP